LRQKPRYGAYTQNQIAASCNEAKRKSTWYNPQVTEKRTKLKGEKEKRSMGQPAVKKEKKEVRYLAGRVPARLYDEFTRRAELEKRSMGNYLEVVLEKFFQEHPMVAPVPTDE
jgi:hypothetical protein